jgi:hypothetical protein
VGARGGRAAAPSTTASAQEHGEKESSRTKHLRSLVHRMVQDPSLDEAFGRGLLAVVARCARRSRPPRFALGGGSLPCCFVLVCPPPLQRARVAAASPCYSLLAPRRPLPAAACRRQLLSFFSGAAPLPVVVTERETMWWRAAARG